MMRHFIFIAIFSAVLRLAAFCQAPDSTRSHDFEASYKLSGYAFVDLIRIAGAGVDYRVSKKFELDAQLGAYYRHGLMSTVIHANDYFDNAGVCIALKTKFYLGRSRHFYIGTYSAINSYGYKNRWEIPDNTNDPDAIRLLRLRELRDKHVNSFVGLGLSLGFTQYLNNKWSLEEFLVFASEQGGQVHERIYWSNSHFYYTNNQPPAFPFNIYYKINKIDYTPVYHGYTIVINLGVKIGYRLL